MTDDEIIEKAIRKAKMNLQLISSSNSVHGKTISDFVDYIVGASVLQAKKEIFKELEKRDD